MDKQSPARETLQEGAEVKPPYLTTSECATEIGVPTRYIYDEIRSGRLAADVVARPPARGRTRGYASIRVCRADFDAYKRKYFKRMFHDEPDNANHANNADAQTSPPTHYR